MMYCTHDLEIGSDGAGGEGRSGDRWTAEHAAPKFHTRVTARTQDFVLTIEPKLHEVGTILFSTANNPSTPPLNVTKAS